MASRAGGSNKLTAIFIELIAVLHVGFFCAVPLAAQPMGGIETSALVEQAGRVAGKPSGEVPETTDALLEQMSSAAGVIFAGQVIAVRKPAVLGGSGQDAAGEIVEIDLRVDQALRGPAAGSIFTLREWSGLWAGRSQRYRLGERLLLFLYPAEANGLSAPVHGAEGAIPLRGSGVAPGPDDAMTSAAEWLVDLRWLQAQVLRKPPYTMLAVRSPSGPINGPVSEKSCLPLHRPYAGDVVDGRDRGLSAELDAARIHAVREPWAVPEPAPVETEPLSQVLALCQQALAAQALGLDATRHHNASR